MSVQSTGDRNRVEPPVSGRRPVRIVDVWQRADTAEWLADRLAMLAETWVEEIRARGWGGRAGSERVLELFCARLLPMLPHLVGGYRDQVEPLWDRGFELYGAVSAKRGLAAGEAIEELHLLRETIIRELYRDPPRGSHRIPFRELLRLNRAVDRAVTHASIGHTDALFFDLIEGEGATTHASMDEVISETEAQLGTLDDEIRLSVPGFAADGSAPETCE